MIAVDERHGRIYYDMGAPTRDGSGGGVRELVLQSVAIESGFLLRHATRPHVALVGQDGDGNTTMADGPWVRMVGHMPLLLALLCERVHRSMAADLRGACDPACDREEHLFPSLGPLNGQQAGVVAHRGTAEGDVLSHMEYDGELTITNDDIQRLVTGKMLSDGVMAGALKLLRELPPPGRGVPMCLP